jgi:uncharacterized protein YceK
MTEELKTRIAGIAMLGALFFFLAFCLLAQGCASMRYGTDPEYVMSLRNPVYVGTQVCGYKLMSDEKVLQSGIDLPFSFIADTGMLPWYLGLYWWHDTTRLPYQRDMK